MDIRDILALNLKKHRAARGLSQEALADAAQIDRTYISALERRRYSVSIDVLDRLATALDVEASELLKRSPAPGAGRAKALAKKAAK